MCSFSLFQCPARWTTLQAVVKPGPNPLPAEVRVKRHASDGENFWGIDHDTWWTKTFKSHIYADRVQVTMRTIIAHAMYGVFGMFKYVKNPDVPEKHFRQLPKPHDACIEDVIQLVDEAYEDMIVYYQTKIGAETDPEEVQALKQTLNKFEKTWANVTSGFVARSLLDLTSTLAVGKNWNSHGAIVGAAVCQISALLAVLSKANRSPVVKSSFRDIIPQGKVLTGQKHGHSDTSYIEFMTSSLEPKVVVGGDELYLEHNNFVCKDHAAKVRAVMDTKVEGKHCPTPRPTRAHTLDFNLSYMGARLIDGECKDKATEDDAGVLVLHSMDQLAYSPSAIAVLTTSTDFKIFYSQKNDVTSRINTLVHCTRRFCLRPVVGDLAHDTAAADFASPPTIAVPGKGKPKVLNESGGRWLEEWGKLRSEIRELICALMECIDVLVELLVKIDLNDVRARRQKAFDQGGVEPFFLSTDVGELKSRRPIHDQKSFRYSKENMEGAHKEKDKEQHQDLKNTCEKLLNENKDDMDPTLRDVLSKIIAYHDQNIFKD